MEAVPDMDDLLDEMEANLIHETRKISTQPPPQQNKENIQTLKVQKLLPNPGFHDDLEGDVKLEIPEMSPGFKPKTIIPQITVESEETPQKEEETVKSLPETVEKPTSTLPEPLPQHTEEQVEPVVKDEIKTEDVEYDEMLNYLNGFEDKKEDTPQDDEIRDIAGKFAEQFMDDLSDGLEDMLNEKINQLKVDDDLYESDHGDEEVASEDSKNPDEADISIEPETQNISMSTESTVDISSSEDDVKSEAEVEQNESKEIDSKSEPEVNLTADHPSNPPTDSEAVLEESEPFIDSDDIITVIEVSTNDSVENEEKENKEKTPEPDNSTDNDSAHFDDDNNKKEFETMSETQNFEESSQEEGESSSAEKSRPRFDSSIATIHVLHESDSEDSPTIRRERRLTESELQLGKTCPYWIPDSDCPLCMLCNAKFTLITRRHHCRACGRVLCGSCCNEKAVLEYLNEEGKKPQAVRVCQPCSTMLARIEAYEQEEEIRRSNTVELVSEDASEEVGGSQAPKGVLKNRPTSEDDASTSENTAVSSEGGSTRKGVMFRDGVRPGAYHEDVEQETKSTALKPKKKSRKRHSVVRRCAELRMEDELACALPNETRNSILIISPENEQIIPLKPSEVWEKLKQSSVVTIVLKKNLDCVLQIVDDSKFGKVWAVSTRGFAQIGLDELFFSWTLSSEENEMLLKSGFSDEDAIKFLPLTVLHRISSIYANSTDLEYAGVRRVESRSTSIHTVPIAANPLSRHILFFRPTIQDFSKFPVPTIPFLVACFLQDEEVQWATACPDRVLHRLGLEYGCYPSPIVNKIGRKSMYTMQTAATVLKVFTDFRSWSYRMKHLPGCTVSLTNDKTLIRIPRAVLSELREIITWNRSMLSWRCDISTTDDSLLICDENDGFYTTQVFARYDGKRDSTSASFVILDGGSKVSSLQVNVVEDGVAIRVQNERLETILTAMQRGNNVIESSKEMEFRVEFFDDEYELSSEYVPKSNIDGRSLLNKYQYGLSLERALTQVLQVQGVSDYGIRLSHVFNLTEGRLSPDEEPRIYGLVEIAARECVAMLEPYIRHLIATDIGSMSIRFFVSSEQVEYDVSSWIGLEEENMKFKQSLDQLIPMLYNMTDVVPNGFEVEMVLSIVSTRPLPI